jgi:hypothetical protein
MGTKKGEKRKTARRAYEDTTTSREDHQKARKIRKRKDVKAAKKLRKDREKGKKVIIKKKYAINLTESEVENMIDGDFNVIEWANKTLEDLNLFYWEKGPASIRGTVDWWWPFRHRK